MATTETGPTATHRTVTGPADARTALHVNDVLVGPPADADCVVEAAPCGVTTTTGADANAGEKVTVVDADVPPVVTFTVATPDWTMFSTDCASLRIWSSPSISRSVPRG